MLHHLNAVVSHYPAAVLLCCIRFLNACKPSEPHIVPYLLQVKGLSETQVLHAVFPIIVYATLAATAAVPLAVRCIGQKASICVAAVARLATRILLLAGSGLVTMQVVEVGLIPA
jgi:Reduced folate carrier